MEIAMKKAVYMALGVLLCLFWLAACGKSGAAETSGTIEARPGGCYLNDRGNAGRDLRGREEDLLGKS